jgi:hypothetical protein
MIGEIAELNSDQRREMVNTRQRFQAWGEAERQARSFRGSMVWEESKGHEYLMRSAYSNAGRRKQKSLGRRSPETETVKANFDRSRKASQERIKNLEEVMFRQAAINRAIGLGRVPLPGAKIIRALDKKRLLGHGIRILGTNALYAYEAAAGVHIEAALTATEDIDLLLDSRFSLDVLATEDVAEKDPATERMDSLSLLKLLQKSDRSFQRSDQTFRAANKDGYLVDLIKPLRNPPWSDDASQVGNDPADLIAVEIEGLSWLESAPAFEAIAIDERGEPLRIVTSDPRVFAAHKLWLSQRLDREPIKKRRDLAQARLTAQIVTTYFPHLAYERGDLRILPGEVFENAAPLFAAR